jgi:predicted DCC family thiol-disulfide oxidoreductase YuxK
MTMPLASIDDRPEGDVVIFDGNCRFCRGQVERLARWDKAGRLAFLPLQDPRAAQRFPDLSHQQLMEQMYVVDRQGRRHGGADAFKYLTRRLPRLWWLAPLMHIPFSLPLWRWAYRHVARRRYRIAGKMADCETGACRMHRP